LLCGEARQQASDFYSNILSKILDVLKGKSDVEKGPIIDPEKYKFGDIHNREYFNNLTQTLDEYKIYILITIGVLAVGILTYTYWDSISNFFGRRGDNGGTPDSSIPNIPSPIPSDPSSGKDVGDYPEGYLNFFSKKLGVLSEKIKDRANQLYSFTRGSGASSNSVSGISSNISLPKGLYSKGKQTMW
jgi:hypothetical protein